jgi:hypothetical protein
MEQLTKVFARHDYDNVLAVTFLNKEPNQSPSQIAKSNKDAFEDKTGVGVQELTEMANGQRADPKLESSPIDEDNLEITQALELNKLKVNNLTAKEEERPVAAKDKEKVNDSMKSKSHRAMVGMA